MKAYTDLEQSKKLAEILPHESADMCWCNRCWCNSSPKGVDYIDKYAIHAHTLSEMKEAFDEVFTGWDKYWELIPAWSLAALLNLIKDKCGYFEFVYLKRTYDGRANPLEDVYRLSAAVYDVYKKEQVDACVAMIKKLHELKLL